MEETMNNLRWVYEKFAIRQTTWKQSKTILRVSLNKMTSSDTKSLIENLFQLLGNTNNSRF